MRKSMALAALLACFCGGLGFTGYGAGAPGPAGKVPVALNLDRFGEEMLRADRWFSSRNDKTTRGASVSLAADPQAGKCLKIDYMGENSFGYKITPTDLSAYEKVEFRIKGSGAKGVFVFELVDEKGNRWGYCNFMTTTASWITLEALLKFPTYDKQLPLDLKRIVRIGFYENEAGGHLEKPSSVYVTDFKLANEEDASAVKATVSSLNSNGNLVFDGKPFFPLGVYSTIGTNAGHVTVSAVPGWLKALKEAGFNTVQSYTVRSKQEYTTWLDDAHKAGLKVIAATYVSIVETALPLEPAAREAEIARRKALLKAHIETVRDHPAMAVYLMSDECYTAGIPKEQMQLFYDFLRSNDRVHPTLLVECTDAGFPSYRKATDMFGPDIYPINRQKYPLDLTVIAKRLDLIRTVQKGSPPRPVLWYMSQIYNKRGADSRFPTEGELRAMSFLALTRDVKGLLYYIYNNPIYTPPYSQTEPQYWQHVGNAIKSIHTVFPALFSNKTITGYTVSSDKIHTIAKEVREGEQRYLYLLAVNPSDGNKQLAPLTVTFTKLPQSGIATIQVLDEDPAGTLKLGSVRTLNGYSCGFTDRFEENAVHVYKIGMAEK